MKSKWQRIISAVAQHYAEIENQGIQRKLSAYSQLKGHQGWKVHSEMLMLLRGAIAEYLLSKEYTELDATEKDIQQRACSMVDDLISFLMNPLYKAQEKAKFYVNFDERLKQEATKQSTRWKRPKGDLK